MADTTIKLSGTYDSIEAYNILEEMRNMGADYADIKTEAEEAATQATAAVATAQAAVTNATTASNNAQTYAGNANDSATAAAGSASSASTAATNALDSQTAAAGSASAAATSASEASASATEAEASAQSMSAFLLQRNTRYAVGDVAYSANLGTRYYLECTVAGTTGATEPSFTTGGVIVDGTCTFVVGSYAMAGEVKAFAGNSTPAGWLLCDGSAVSRTTYARLFEVIGTTYGSGDGSNTFNLPNLTDKFIQGNATAGKVKTAGLPDIKGSFNVRPWGTGVGDIVNDTFGTFHQESISQAGLGSIASGGAGTHLQRYR